MKRSNTVTLSLPWNQIGSTLPNLAQFIRLSLQKLRLEYKDKEAMPAIWHELGKKIGRRGCLQVDGLFEMGCGANPSTRIDSAKHPNKFLQACLAEGNAHSALTPFATLKEGAKVRKSDSTVKEQKVVAA